MEFECQIQGSTEPCQICRIAPIETRYPRSTLAMRLTLVWPSSSRGLQSDNLVCQWDLAKVISVTVERNLLARSDALAKNMGVTRAGMIARGQKRCSPPKESSDETLRQGRSQNTGSTRLTPFLPFKPFKVDYPGARD